MTTATQDTIDQTKGQELIDSFTGMTDEQQAELFAAVKRIEGNGDGHAVEHVASLVRQLDTVAVVALGTAITQVVEAGGKMPKIRDGKASWCSGS